MRRLSLAGLLLCGCGSVLAVRYADPSVLKAPQDDVFAGAPAVALLSEEHVLLFAQGPDSHTEILGHEAIYVRGEAGKTFGSVRIPLMPKQELVELHARVLEPDGTVVEVPEKQVMEQNSESDNRGVGARVFHFPDVRVGSTLEYVYLLRQPLLNPTLTFRIRAALPAVRRELAVTVNYPIVGEPEAYNGAPPVQEHRDDDFYRTYRWTAENVPATHEEPFAANWTLDEPWWAFQIDALTYPGGRLDVMHSWESAMRWWGEETYLKDRLYAGFRGHPISGCSPGADGKRCLVDRAVEYVRDATDWDGFGEFDKIRPLKHVVQGGRATTFEKALILRRVLAEAGVMAKLAATSRAFSTQVHLEAPTPTYWNYLLVHVPRQNGLDEDLWIDPTCEYCKAGELPAWTRDVDAVVFYRPQVGMQLQARVVKATGKAPPIADGRETSYDVDVTAGGDVSVKAAVSAHGLVALEKDRQRRGWNAEAKRKDAQAYVTGRSPAGQLESFDYHACDKVHGECRIELDFGMPGLAVAQGDRLLVPLAFLAHNWQHKLAADRRVDVVFETPERNEETAHVRVPAGYVLTAGSDWEKQLGAVTASFKVTASPDGAVVHRRFEAPVGRWSGADVGALASVTNGFAETREQVLVFERKPGAPASAAGNPPAAQR